MWKLLKFSHRYAALIIVFTIAVTAAFVTQIWDFEENKLRVKIKVSSDELIPDDSQMERDFEVVRDTFGSDEVAVIYVQDKELFSKDKLNHLKNLHDRLKRVGGEKGFLERIESVFTVNNIKGEGGWIDTSPLLDRIPKRPRTIAKKKETAISNPLLVRNVVSENGTATSLTLYLETPDKIKDEVRLYAEKYLQPMEAALTKVDGLVGEEGKPPPYLAAFREIQGILKEVRQNDPQLARSSFGVYRKIILKAIRPGAKLEKDPVKQMLAEIEKFRAGDPHFAKNVYRDVENVLKEFNNSENKAFEKLFQVGSPAIQVQMTDYITEDQMLLLPLSAAVLVLIIGVMLKSLVSAFIPVINALISATWTVGTMYLLDVPINMLNYIVPALILVIGATEDVHLLVDYREAKAKSLKGLDLISEVGHKIGLTLALTGVTTVLGFAATSWTDIIIMRDFGITAALGMFSRFVVSVVFLPAFLRYFGRFIKPASSKVSANNLSSRMTESFTQMVMKKIVPHPVKSCGTFLLIACIGGFFAKDIKLSNDFLSFLKQDSKLVKELDTVADNLCGTKVIYLTLYGQEDEFKEAKKIRLLESIGKYLRELDKFDTVISLADYLALVNKEMYDGDEGKFTSPATSQLVAQYLLFFHHKDIEPYVSGDFSKANIVIRCNINDSHELNLLMDDIRAELDDGKFGHLKYTLSGKSIMVSKSVDQLASGQAKSIFFMALILFVIIAILFISIKASFMTVIANMFAVIILFGIMGLCGIPLNVGTCMVAAITIGIGIDDTLHLMVRYNKELKIHKNETAGIANAIRAEFVPVLVTSMGLAGGFLVLGTSSFVPVMQFGLLSAGVIFLAVVADLILTPLLLSTTRLITIWDLVGLNLRKQLMTTSPVFKGMNTMQAKKLILASQVETFEQGANVITAGEEGETFYVVLEGELEVSIQQGKDKVIISYLTMGEAFGEIALISRMKRTANVIAKTNTKLLVYDWDSLVRLRRFAPFLSSQLLLNLASILGMRLVDAQRKLDADDSQPLKPKGGPLKRTRDKM